MISPTSKPMAPNFAAPPIRGGIHERGVAKLMRNKSNHIPPRRTIVERRRVEPKEPPKPGESSP